MDSQIERISPVECRVRVEIPWTEVSGRLTDKLRDLRRKARLPGFRPGKVPPQVIEKMYGKSVRQELAGELVQETFQTAVSQHGTVPLTQPVVESSSLQRNAPFTYAARFEVPPLIVPKDYKGATVRRRPAKAADDKVEAQLHKHQEELTQLLPIPEDATDRETEAGDVWTVDVEGSIGEAPVSRKDVRIEIGSEENEFIPGLAKAFEGTARGEVGGVKKLAYTPPQDRMREEFRGSAATLTPGLRDVRIKHVPDLDDEFARDTGQAETLDELREKIVADVLQEDADEAEREARRALVTELLERNHVDPAPSMVAREVQAQVNSTKQQLAQQGLNLGAVGTSEGQLAQQIRPQALFNVSAYLLLDAIGKAENIEVTDEEVDAEIEQIAEERGQNAARTRATMEKDDRLILLRAQIRENKILEFLMGEANVTEADAEPAAASEDAKGGSAKAKSTKKKSAKKKSAKKKSAKKAAARVDEGGDSAADAEKKKSQGSRRHRRKKED